MENMELSLLNARKEFDGLLEVIETGVKEQHALHEVERSLFRSLLRLGFHLLCHFLMRKGVGDQGPTLWLNDGQALLRGEVETRPYRSIFGEMEIARYVYGSGQNAQVPLDAQLNLPEWKYSYLLQEWGLGFATGEAFREVQKILDKILGTDISVYSQERLSRKVATDVAPFRQEQSGVFDEEEGAFLIAAVDCKGIPLTRKKEEAHNSSHRRKKGEKANKKKMACVSAVYTIAPFVRSVDDIVNEIARDACAKDRPVPQNKRVRADLVEDKEATFIQVAKQLQQRQTKIPKPVIFLSDGERRLWKLQKKHLAQAIGILDLWHVMEYVWKAAHVFHKEGSQQAEDFVTHRIEMLLEGNVAYVIAGLKQMGTKHRLRGNKQKTLQSVITYLHNNKAHMHYDVYIAAGYPIGSGVAEGACRHLVKDRLERTGMRWVPEGAQAMLDLRSAYLNDEWDALWGHYPAAEKKRLYGNLNCDTQHTYAAIA
jgi:hypothetical protein